MARDLLKRSNLSPERIRLGEFGIVTMRKRFYLKRVFQLVIATFLGWCPLVCLSQDLVQEFDPINKGLGLMGVANNGSFFVLGGNGISLRWTQSGEEWLNITEDVEFHSNTSHRPVDISPDDSLMAWVGGGMVRIFDLKLGRIISRFSKLSDDQSYFRGPIKFQPNSNRIAVSSYGTNEVAIVNYSSGEIVQRIHHPQSDPKRGNIDFSYDGHLLTYGGGSRGRNTLVHVFDLKEHKTVRVIKTSTSYGVTDIDLSDNGKWLATATLNGIENEDSMVEIWDIQKGDVFGRIKGSCAFLHFMDKGSFLAVLRTLGSQGEDTLPDQVQFWRVHDMKLMKSIELEGRRGEYPARYTMQGFADDSGVMVQYRGSTKWIEENGEFQPVKPTYVAVVSTPPMISHFSVLSQNSLSIKWAGGKPPFDLLFRSQLNERWITQKEGINDREVTIQQNHQGVGFYGIQGKNP